ncbi:MAG: NAD(P)H-hydrate dehydratase [Candidatus Omnitrophota bacterium]
MPTRLLRRKADSNKGDFGHIFILAGSAPFSGAAVLCSTSAMRSGSGLVTLGIPKGINNAIIKIKLPEVMTLPLAETKEGNISVRAYKKIVNFVKKVDVVVIGPGLGKEESTQSLARKLIKKINKPMVIDADGLNALAKHLELLRVTNYRLPITRILTPHPGEMSRLCGKNIKEIQDKRETISKKFAAAHKVTLVLKGYKTIVADFKNKLYINKTGNPGMSTAGCGDVLTGIIASFLGQKLDVFNAAKYAVYIHGLAGDLAAKEKSQLSLTASDIIDKLPEAIMKSGLLPA